MFSRLTALLGLLLLSLSFAASADESKPRVAIETSMGNIVLELDAEKAPKSVENFLAYVDDGFYEGTIFHRVIPNFMIQGGGYDTSYVRKPTRAAIENEADNGLRNARGTIAMARTQAPHSATAQFFINHRDNSFLNYSGKSLRGWGYAVFGRVMEGMDVVDEIANVRTGKGGPFPENAPQTKVIIKAVRRIEP
ncbi:MAG: peptidylprolyl isomerase [Gammaproteobacteria bacterium]